LGLGSGYRLALADARNKAVDFHRAIANGQDPVEAKRLQRKARQAQITFADLANTYITAKQPGWSQAHSSGMRWLLLGHAQALGRLAVANVTTKDIEAAMRPLWTRAPTQGRKAVSAISQLFDYAIALEYRNDNPADWKRRMKLLLPRRRPEDIKHHTAMDYAQIPDFVRKLRKEQQRDTKLSPHPHAIEFLLLTACRANEVVGMKWPEVNFEHKLWTVPASRAKARREHRVPLADRALALLVQQHQRTDGPYVWQRRNDTRPVSTKILYFYLTRNMGIPVTIHGFRSSFRDFAGNETNADRETCEMCLGHKIGNATELAYRRSDALAKRRALMDAWADYCAGKPIAPSQEAPQRATGGHW
jgi:integrase